MSWFAIIIIDKQYACTFFVRLWVAVLTRLTTYALGDNPQNPHYALVHDNWLTSWISRPRAFGPRARNPLGQPVIALGHKWILGVIPSGIGG